MKLQHINSKGMSKLLLPTAVCALVVFAAIGFYIYKSNIMIDSVQPTTVVLEEDLMSDEPTVMETDSAYKDGTYSVVGNYVSPGGPREIKVTITLVGDAIESAEAQGTATDATSKRFQGEFVENFKTQVIGKNIDEVVLSKVSGSSLTPKGFNDAIEKLKVEAGV